MKHSPEPWSMKPWSRDEFYVIDARGLNVAWCSVADASDGNGKWTSIDEPEAKANAERIAACVNACAGVEDPKRGELLTLREVAKQAGHLWECTMCGEHIFESDWRVVYEDGKHVCCACRSRGNA